MKVGMLLDATIACTTACIMLWAECRIYLAANAMIHVDTRPASSGMGNWMLICSCRLQERLASYLLSLASLHSQTK